MSGGGTAGHIYPAIALADKLIARGDTVEYVGTPTGLESRIVPQAGIPFLATKAHGFNRSKPWTLITSSFEIMQSALKMYRHFQRANPDVVVGFGGYVSVPVGLAARWRGIPLVVHEQNSVLGMTNAYLSRKAVAVGVTYPATISDIQRKTHVHVVHTGNPVRKEVLDATRQKGREIYSIPEDATLLVVFGGSRGARTLNTALVNNAARLLENEHLYIIHATGAGEFETVHSRAKETALLASGRYTVVPYLEDMGSALAAADFVVCRAGATTIAEITAVGVPAIVVPYPYATADHQTTNAQALVDAGAAFLIPDAEIDSDKFVTKARELISNKTLRDSMAYAARALCVRDATDQLVALVDGAAHH